MSVWFKGVNEPNSWMENMASYPITYYGQIWLSIEVFKFEFQLFST